MINWSARIPAPLERELQSLLFPGDGRPHAAALLAGVAEHGSQRRLLIREVIHAVDGLHYVPGSGGRGHHRLTATFVRDAVFRAEAHNLAYLAVHAHGGVERVALSPEDLRSHERGYPALRDLVGAGPVGALVFTEEAVAGDIWSADGRRAPLDALTVIGPRIRTFAPAPRPSSLADPAYDRQARLFGDAGQAIMAGTKVALIGVGGMGMLLAEYLGRLGVRHILLIDPDRVERSNLPRLPGARISDARTVFQDRRWPAQFRRIGSMSAARKVDLATRLVREANPGASPEAIFGDVREPEIATRLLDCDYLFLAANSDQARLLFNAVVHQYLIPGVQIGAKVHVDGTTGNVLGVHSIVRTVYPGSGCLWCNEVISPTRLAEEAATPSQRRAQRYVDDPSVVAPSVITLNATAAAIAANDFLHSITGLTMPDASLDYCRVQPLDRDVVFDRPRVDHDCTECSATGRLALGDRGPRLPTFFRG